MDLKQLDSPVFCSGIAWAIVVAKVGKAERGCQF